MILYNVTLSVDDSIETKWLHWMRTKHIKDVLATGCFSNARLLKLTSHNQPGSTNYAVQYLCENAENLADYYQKYADELRNDGVNQFGDAFQAFRTELDVVEDFFVNQS